ncbi:hypothetical protein FB451DRAFT_1555641 [Mycena latifolia]|nr:hypothetical protein FB451DRAFT_1555641 [Mycena latifolia]
MWYYDLTIQSLRPLLAPTTWRRRRRGVGRGGGESAGAHSESGSLFLALLLYLSRVPHPLCLHPSLLLFPSRPSSLPPPSIPWLSLPL